MKKLLTVGSACFLLFTSMAPGTATINEVNTGGGGEKLPSLLTNSYSDESVAVRHVVDSLYTTMSLEKIGLKKSIFFAGLKGYEYLLSKNKIHKEGILTICDYSQSSSQKRLYVLDINHAKVLFNTYVSHGKNSGGEYATSFSNREDSHKSSLGFMVTDDTYFGKAGLSLHLDGLERGINSNVRMRDIVIHGSNYVNSERADEGSQMGRSYGCPAVPIAISKKIINTIKGGTCFFGYSNDKWYATNSSILQARFDWPIAKPLLPEPIKANESLAKLSPPQLSINPAK
ncbi:MAG: murein L,D-transpeptidase catalytic domain family protein [Bacteroidetes bacterium]|nr:murein L,D-transpeptidase catalytic domain family protein [Bacteroidota bacterium]